jgi:hypothetical protein
VNDLFKRGLPFEIVDLRGLYLGEAADSVGLQAFSEALKATQSLEILEIPTKNITVEGAKLLEEALKVNRSLHTFIVNNNGGKLKPYRWEEGITTGHPYSMLGQSRSQQPNDFLWLSAALKTNQSLTEVDLSHNAITLDGWKWLSEALKTNQSLTSLNLTPTHVSPEGCHLLSEALKHNQVLSHLVMNNNYIATEGCRWLSGALKVSQSLTELGLYNNNITADGCKWLTDGLKFNQSLLVIDLEGNDIMSEGFKWLLDCLKINRALIRVVYDQKHMQVEEIQNMQQMFDRNRNFQRELITRTIIAIISVAKRPESYCVFPAEIWVLIFKHISFPGIQSFEGVAKMIFANISAICDKIRDHSPLTIKRANNKLNLFV